MKKKICLMRLSAIGDVCHAAALVHRIKSHWPDAEITWVIGKIEYQLLKGMTGVRFIVFDKKQGKQAVKDLRHALKDEYFDALLMMQVALRANLASRVIKARERIGFDWARSKELHWLFANKRVNAATGMHVLDGFMDFGDALGLPAQTPQWDITVPQDASVMASALKQEIGPFVVISPAASKAERNWLPERYAQVADHIKQKGFAVVLTGGPGPLDQTLSASIQQHTGSVTRELVGKTSLQEMLAVLAEANLVIAPDTGPAHMATVVGTPVIGLYAHSNPRRTGPYNNLDNVVSVYDTCIAEQTGKSWDVLPWGTRAKGSTLMSKISTTDVMEMVDQLL